MRKIYLAAFTILAGSGVMAQEGGEAILTLGDAEYAFTLLPSSDFSGSPQYPSVSMTLSGPREDNPTGINGLILGFESFGTDVQAAEARLVRGVDGTNEFLFCHEEAELGGLTVELDELAIEGKIMNVTGRFSCEFGTSDNFGRDIDLSDPLPVSGTFKVKLQRL